MWQHYLEIVVITLVALSAIGALTFASWAVVHAWRISAPQREATKAKNPQKPIDMSALTPERRDELLKYFEDIRKKYGRYADDMHRMSTPLRRDAIEFIKESATWGRLVIQYAMIGNGGGLVAALPFLLSDKTAVTLPMGDALFSASWFVVGLLSAAGCCLVAYVDFQISATIHWHDADLVSEFAVYRNFETDAKLPTELTLRDQLRLMNLRTGLSGITLGIISWIALAWGALRVLVSLIPSH